MGEATSVFGDGAAYERFMGRWSRAVGAVFLDWIAPPRGADWLDVGCGTGVFTELVLDRCSPVTVIAIDPSVEQVDYARMQPVAQMADFRVADAQALPFPDGTFDVVASALVVNFIPDLPRAITEMRRVGRPAGMVGGYVWDFAAERAPNSLLRLGLRQIGADPRPAPGTDAARLETLSSLFAQAGLEDIATTTIEVTLAFPDFNDLWRSLTARSNAVTKMIETLPETDRARLIHSVRAKMPARLDGSIACSARANAIKARVPE